MADSTSDRRYVTSLRDNSVNAFFIISMIILRALLTSRDDFLDSARRDNEKRVICVNLIQSVKFQLFRSQSIASEKTKCNRDDIKATRKFSLSVFQLQTMDANAIIHNDSAEVDDEEHSDDFRHFTITCYTPILRQQNKPCGTRSESLQIETFLTSLIS